MNSPNTTSGDGEEPTGFGAALSQARTAQGLSLAEVARRTSYSAGHLSNVERGIRSASPELAEACDRVLNCQGALLRLVDAAAEAAPLRPARTVPPRLLPPVPGLFVGRSAELATLDEILTQPSVPGAITVVGLDGAPGVGKTTLALRWAHQLSEQFPGGALFADLHGYSPDTRPTDPAAVLDLFLQALGVPPPDIPPSEEARSGLLRTLLDGTRTLMVLDNAASSDQVRPLLPASAGCLVIVTCRHHLPSLAVRTDAHRLMVPPLTTAESLELIAQIIGADELAAHRDAAERIARHCDGLPLAIRVAVVRATAEPHTGLDRIADALPTRALHALTVTENDITVRAVFGSSYRALTPEQARLYRALGLHPGDIGLAAATALTDTTTTGTAQLMGSLADAHLVEPIAPTRWRLHDLLHAYAAERAHQDDTTQRRRDLQHRMIGYYAHTAQAASHIIAPLRQTHPCLRRTGRSSSSR